MKERIKETGKELYKVNGKDLIEETRNDLRNFSNLEP